jgi:hypothetical protein
VKQFTGYLRSHTRGIDSRTGEEIEIALPEAVLSKGKQGKAKAGNGVSKGEARCTYSSSVTDATGTTLVTGDMAKGDHGKDSKGKSLPLAANSGVPEPIHCETDGMVPRSRLNEVSKARRAAEAQVAELQRQLEVERARAEGLEMALKAGRQVWRREA